MEWFIPMMVNYSKLSYNFEKIDPIFDHYRPLGIEQNHIIANHVLNLQNYVIQKQKKEIKAIDNSNTDGSPKSIAAPVGSLTYFLDKQTVKTLSLIHHIIANSHDECVRTIPHFKKAPSSKRLIIDDICAGFRCWGIEHSATEEDVVIKLKDMCRRSIIPITLKSVLLDDKSRQANKKLVVPSFKYLVGQAPCKVLSDQIMMNLEWDPKI